MPNFGPKSNAIYMEATSCPEQLGLLDSHFVSENFWQLWA